MRKTYAPNSIIIGILIGILVAVKVNTIFGILAGLGISVLGWVLIRAFENALNKVGDAAEDAIQKKLDERKDRK